MMVLSIIGGWPFALLVLAVLFGFCCGAGRDPKGDMLNGPRG